jgi:hypothetical protein
MTAARTAWTCCAGLFVCLALAAPSFAGETPPREDTGPMPQALLDEEDAVDRLAPAEQVDRYLALREKVLKEKVAAAEAVSARLARKVDLARARAGAPEPTYSQRLEFCKQAARIGEDYVKADDPERALRWEGICRDIDAASQWAAMLRNRVHEWFEQRLTKAAEAGEWDRSRAIVAEWTRLTSGDAAAIEGRNKYARARLRPLRAVLRDESPRAALEKLREEEKLYPGLEPWKELRKEIAAELQAPFVDAMSRGKYKEAAEELKQQADLITEFKLPADFLPITENRRKQEDLEAETKPSDLELPYGHVLSPFFRFEAGANYGKLDCDESTESASGMGIVPEIKLEFRFFNTGYDWLWYGASANGYWSTVSDGRYSGDVMYGQVNALVGLRGDAENAWAAWLGIGGAYASTSFDGVINSTSGDGFLAPTVLLGGEYALTESITLHGEAMYGGLGDFVHWRAKAGGRYYLNHNFALGIHGVASRLTNEDAGAEGETMEFTGGAAVLVQF